MVYNMIMGDMRTFGMIYSVMLFGFSQSFYFLYKGFPGVESSLYHSYFSTWMALFQITLGDYNVSSPLVIALLTHSFPRFPYLYTHMQPVSIPIFFPLALLYAHAAKRSRKALSASACRVHLSSDSLPGISNEVHGVSRHHRPLSVIVTRRGRSIINKCRPRAFFAGAARRYARSRNP